MKCFDLVLALALYLVAGKRVSVDAARLHVSKKVTAEDSNDVQPHLDLSNPVAQADRLTCLREDDLDLAIPSSPEYILRKVIGVNAGDTGRDTFVTATKVRIDKLSAIFNLERIGRTKFRFTLSGDSKYGAHNDVAAIEFYLEGVNVMTKSSAIDWIASLATNRDKLEEGQTGTLYFKLMGEAEAQWNSGTGEWDVVLSKTDLTPFQFQITSQYILQEALTKAGGIEQIIMDNLWPAVKAAVPSSLAQAFHYLDPEELWVDAKVTVWGAMKESNGPLELGLDVTSNVAIVPAAALEVLTGKDFNIVVMAQEKVDAFLANEKWQKLFVKSREAFIQQLGHLGFLFDDAFLKKVESIDELSDIREELMEYAKTGADTLLKVVKPFIAARDKGQTGFFQGLAAEMVGEAGWHKDTRDGRFSASLKGANTVTAGTQNMFELPQAFLESIGASVGVQSGSLSADSDIEMEGFSFKQGALDIARLNAREFMFKSGNNTVNDIYKFNGEVHDIALSLPMSLDLGVELSCPKVLTAVSESGDVTISVATTGLQVNEAIPTLQRIAKLNGEARDGAENQIDGALSAQFSRPTESIPALDRLTVAPVATSSVNVKISGIGHKLTMGVQAVGSSVVQVDNALRTFLAPRPQLDFGYVFFTETFNRYVTNGESGVDGSSTTVAVVSCGFLRLLKVKADRDAMKRLDMSPSTGQLQLDLSKYTSTLSVSTTGLVGSDEACVFLYKSGQEARKTGWFKNTVVEKLCGSAAQIQALTNAVNMQIVRFHDSRATAWNYGTHKADPQYVLPEANTGTLNLTKIVNLHRLREGALLDVSESKKELAVTPMSSDRKSCKAREDLDRKIFPPEQFGTKAIRMAVADLPTVGDMHLILDKIQFTGIDLLVSIERKNDDTFSFEVTGQHGAKMGTVNAWIEGLDFQTPTSSLAGFASGMAATENILWTGITLGMGSREHGRVDQGKVDIRMNLKSDFKFDAALGEWVIVPTNDIPDVQIDFGSGGIVQAIVNSIIKGNGGIKQMFFDSVAPILVKLIPVRLGSAFEIVPHSLAQIKHEFQISGKCEHPSERRCVAQELELDIKDVTHITGIVKPILTSYMGKVNSTDGALDTILQNIVDAYEDGKPVLTGSKVAAHTALYLNPTSRTPLNIDAVTDANLPMPLLQSVIGEGSPIIDFLPTSTPLLAAGSVNLKGGVVTVPENEVKGVRLPIVIGDGTEAVELSCKIKGFTLERVSTTSTEPSMLFDSTSPLEVNAPRFQVSIDRSAGLDADFKPELTASLGSAYVTKMLTDATAALAQPTNVRSAVETAADGVIPAQFKRPASRMTGKLHLSQVIKTLTASVALNVEGHDYHARSASMGTDKAELTLTANVQTTLLMDNSFWRGLIDAKDKDFGYAHVSTPVTFGEIKKGKFTKDYKALVMMACGTLEIFKIASSTSTPFDDTPKLTFDLTAAKDTKLLAADLLHFSSTQSCMQCKEDEGSFLPWDSPSKEYICGARADMTKLHAAVLLQLTRFADVPAAVRQNPEGSLERMSSPDGTWFIEIDPKTPATYAPEQKPPASMADVFSPAQAWAAAGR